MKRRILICLVVVLLSCISAAAQQAQMQPLTFWYEYTVNPGKEDQFLDLVKTVGAPVRDKMMADGVVLAWGVQTSILREPGSPTHFIWYAVADWAGIEKVQNAMGAQVKKLNEEGAKAGATKKGGTPSASLNARLMETADVSKTRDFVTRDLVFAVTSGAPPADLLPYSRYNFVKVKPGKGSEYRKIWEKYNKPVLDKLLADGTVLAYGLSVEEVRTEGSFTHYTWYDMKDLASMDKIRAAFVADREHRSQEEQDAIAASFGDVLDLEASRAEVDRSLIFKVGPMK
jgi:hypothetical protein